MSNGKKMLSLVLATGFLTCCEASLTGIQHVYAADAVKQSADAEKISHDKSPELDEKTLTDFTLETITVEAKRPDWEAKLSPGTVTVIRPDDYKGEQKSLPDLLKMVPGVHVRELSGRGQYTTVTIRGSTAAQVGVFVDGVLFNLGGDAAADVSTIPVKNVERIEVYRGYIPVRFGGTYMGGVINIVTKRPTDTNVNVRLGKSSYHGTRGGLQIDQPLGKGTLMIGINREQSKGDFRYKNHASFYNEPYYRSNYESYKNTLDNWERNAINLYYDVGVLDGTQKDYFLNSLEHGEWDKMMESGEVASIIHSNYEKEALQKIDDNTMTKEEYSVPEWEVWEDEEKYGHILEKWWGTEEVIDNTGNDELWEKYENAKGSGDFDAYLAFMEELKQHKNQYAENLGKDFLDYISHNGEGYLGTKERVKWWKKYYDLFKNHYRYRMNNDYKNTDVIVKWQDDKWTAKFAWKEIDRHLPTGLFSTSITDSQFVDTDILDWYMSKRKQTLTSKEALLGRRDTIGNLEWGWNINYTDQDKRYRCENWEELYENDPYGMYPHAPFRKWSAYDSTRWGGAVDGTWKMGNRHMLEFMINYSDEHMKVAGSGVSDIETTNGPSYSNIGRYRTRYKQKLFNAQVQDTITLNKKGDLWLTPSIRYNQAQTFGSNGIAYDWMKKNDSPVLWMFEPIDQTDNKVTWQLALKKQFSDRFTLRGTCGTYYRLLNLYEIAGDGGGILPAPLVGENVGGDVHGLKFPSPEKGRQYDITAIWNGKLWGADNKTQLTWFWRKSDNLLMLWRWGYDYWSYDNGGKGLNRGIELQTDFNWKKFDFTLGATYLNSHRMIINNSPTGGQYWYKALQPYTPEWEGFARIAYRPDDRITVFGEVKHVGKMFVYDNKIDPWIQNSLTTVNLGLKYKFGNKFDFAAGCNDIFNRSPKQAVVISKAYGPYSYYNTDYPLQGRTYYVSMQYKF